MSRGGMSMATIEQIPARLGVPSQAVARSLASESAFLQRMNQPAWRSGFPLQTNYLNARTIKPIELPKLNPSQAKWWERATNTINELKGSAPSDRIFYKNVRQYFENHNLSEIQIRHVLNYSGFKTYPRPAGLPKDCLVEFADKNGGMIYRKPGTTNPQNIIVRIMDGTRKENVVTAFMEGKDLGHWRQQTPYVVQRRGELYLTRDGEWIKDGRDPRAHIPLEIFEFKGW